MSTPILTRDQVNMLIAIAVIVLSAIWPETKPYLDVIAPSIVGLLLILLGIPAAERAYTARSQAIVEAARLQLAATEGKLPR